MSEQQALEREQLRKRLRQILGSRRIDDDYEEEKEKKKQRICLEPIYPATQKEGRKGQRLLFRAKKKRTLIKNKQEKSIIDFLDKSQKSQESKKIDSMFASINRSTKQQSKHYKSDFQLANSKQQRRKNKSLVLSWMDRSSSIVRRYGNQLQSFQRLLQDRYISERINNQKASSDVCLTKLDKQYKEHQNIVQLREQYKVVTSHHRRKKYQC